MKKYNFKKLSLNKCAVSNLKKINGGIASPQDPVPITVASVCGGVCSKIHCATRFCTVEPMCNGVSYYIC